MSASQGIKTMDQAGMDRSTMGMDWRRFVTFRRGVLVVLLVLALLAGVKLARVGGQGWQGYRHGLVLRDALEADRSLAVLIDHREDVEAVAAALAGLEKELRPFAFLLRWMDGVTAYGSTLAAAPDLLVVGAEYATLAARALSVIAPVLPAGDVDVEALIQAVGSQGEALAQLSGYADRAAAALASVDVARLHPRLVQPLLALQPLSPLLGDSLQITSAIPQLLGMNGPVTYLVLVQNNHELRGTGGFITGVGVLKVERGRVADLTFSDSYAVDNLEVSHPPAPPQMQKYIKADLLFLRDANWSPDLPTSARTIDTIYTRDKGVQVDGIITVDLRAVELLVGALGQVEVEGLDKPITAANVVQVIKELWGTTPTGDQRGNFMEWLHGRKDFMPLIAQAILAKLKTGRFNYFALIGAAQKSMAERAVQLWMREANVQAQLHAWGWDGSLLPQADADFVALVDTNLGFNKVDAVMRRSLDYRVYWLDGPSEPATVQATITYEHSQPVPGLEKCVIDAYYGETYDDMTERCYFDYVRLYAPRGSKLVSVQGVDSDSIVSRSGEAGTQVFGAFFSMQPGRTHQITFTYRLPAAIRQTGYRLVIQRQSGSGPLPIRWQVANRAFTGTITQNTFVWAAR
ncbi:MAG: DUF4012 domain-containing protein [Chloroflexi bacterium]|nr:DUF4012 domain-containing protein [Chloroflexota bacterium]